MTQTLGTCYVETRVAWERKLLGKVERFLIKNPGASEKEIKEYIGKFVSESELDCFLECVKRDLKSSEDIVESSSEEIVLKIQRRNIRIDRRILRACA